MAIEPLRHVFERLGAIDHGLQFIVQGAGRQDQLAHVELLALREKLRILREIGLDFGLARAHGGADALLHVGLRHDQGLGPFDRLHDFRIAVDLFLFRFILQQLAVDQRLEQLLAGGRLLRRLHAGPLQLFVELQDGDFLAIDAGQRLARLLVLVAAGGQAGRGQQDQRGAQQAWRTRDNSGVDKMVQACSLAINGKKVPISAGKSAGGRRWCAARSSPDVFPGHGYASNN